VNKTSSPNTCENIQIKAILGQCGLQA